MTNYSQVEAELKSCKYVDNICVYGDSFQNYLVAMVVPNPLAIRALAKSLGLNESSGFEYLCSNATLVAQVTADIIVHGQRSGLHKSEIPLKYRLCWEEWTADSGLVTAALKIRRKPIKDYYLKDIEQMYGVEVMGRNNNGAVEKTKAKKQLDCNGNQITNGTHGQLKS